MFKELTKDIDTNIVPGLESIHFQSTPAVAKAFTTIFQKAIDYRDNLDYSKKPKGSTDQVYRLNEMKNYTSKVLSKDITDFFKKQFNIVVDKFYSNAYPQMTFFFGISLDFSMAEPAFYQYERMQGTLDYGKLPRNKKFSTITEQFDQKSGTLKSSKYNKDRVIKVHLHFDQNFAFLLKDFTNEHITKDITAEELAAIMLHEAGHAMSLIERAADEYYVVEKTIAHIDYLSSISSKKDIDEILIPQTREMLNHITNKGSADKGIIDKMNTAMDNVTYTSNVTEDSIPSAILQLLFGTIFNIIIIFFKIMSYLTLILPIISIIKGITENDRSMNNRTSDVGNTKRNDFHGERLADEFVNRMGFGAHLASGLEKLVLVMRSLPEADAFSNTRLNRSSAVLFLIRIISNIQRMISAPININLTYEEDSLRIKRMLQNDYKVFKNKLDNTALNHYIKDTESIMETYTKVQNSDKFMKFINKVVDLFNPSAVVTRLLTGNKSNDLHKLLDQIDDITNSKMNYQSAKFQQLALEYANTGNESFNKIIRLNDYESFINYNENEIIVDIEEPESITSVIQNDQIDITEES